MAVRETRPEPLLTLTPRGTRAADLPRTRFLHWLNDQDRTVMLPPVRVFTPNLAWPRDDLPPAA
jgi:hypothetical protein